jgi:alpha-ribazole phosphatase
MAQRILEYATLSCVTSTGETRLYLIRHGETPRQGFCNGHLDEPLTANGIAEIEAVAQRLAGMKFAALYASDLGRAIQSADILGRVLHIRPIISPPLREKCFGEWEGLPQAEIQRRFPGEWEEWVVNPADAKPTGGETCREMAARVLPVIEQIIKRHLGEQVAIVAHGGVNRVILCHSLGLDLRYMERIAQRHAALNIIEVVDKAATVQLMNG